MEHYAIQEGIEYIKRNYMKNLGLEEIACQCHLSPSYFSSLFKKFVKCNVNTYINRIRIDRGKELLIKSSLSLSEISKQIGFNENGYFSKVFRQHIGLSPLEFRFNGGYIADKSRKSIINSDGNILFVNFYNDKKFIDNTKYLNIKHKNIIYDAICFINKNYMQKITLQQMAEHVSISTSYFSKIFKDEVHVNFSNYLNVFRVLKSKEFLEDNTLSITYISQLVGFGDHSYYSKSFREYVGMSPSEYCEAKLRKAKVN